MTATLAVIAKAPVPGRVKTRLCPPLSPVQAAALAEAALADTLAAVARTPAARRVAVLDGEPGPWLPDGFDVIAQRGDGLAARLADATAQLAGPLLMVGMDTPQVTPELLGDALRRLAEPGVDAVLGPAGDGGYWALGLAVADPEVFAGVPMSRPATGAAQRARLDALGLRTALLPTLHDVDTIADARAAAALAPGSRFAAALAGMGR